MDQSRLRFKKTKQNIFIRKNLQEKKKKAVKLNWETRNPVTVSDSYFIKHVNWEVCVIFPIGLNAAWFPLPVDVWTANTAHHLR